VTLLQADALFACLDRHRVEYRAHRGLAAVLHGSPLVTADADICPSRAPDNLDRLAAALDELDARIRTPDAGEGIRFPREAGFLRGVDVLNLVTSAGDLDLAFTLAKATADFTAVYHEDAKISKGSRRQEDPGRRATTVCFWPPPRAAHGCRATASRFPALEQTNEGFGQRRVEVVRDRELAVEDSEPATRAFLSQRDQFYGGPAGPRDDDLFASFDALDELGQIRLRLMNVHLLHERPPRHH
jgi:hypothetical protein